MNPHLEAEVKNNEISRNIEDEELKSEEVIEQE